MERKQLESAGANYGYLRGLFGIPIGLLIILAALGNWEVGPLIHDWVFLAAVLAIGMLCLPINRYYNENYGRVRASMRQQLRIAIATLLALIVVVGGSELLRSNAGWSLDLPVNATAITFAVVMLMSYAIGIGLKAHHVIIWGALFVAGAVPVWNGADPSNIGLVLNGVAVTVCGIFDHRLFVRTFGSPKAAALQDGDVHA
jgi:hypothetical protein